MTASYNEDLLDSLPQHLAGTYARFIDQRDPAAQHTLLLALFESMLKYWAAAAAAQYTMLAGDDLTVRESLTRLQHPSLGHWAGLLRSVLAWRRRQELRDVDFVFPELAALYSKAAPELVAGATLLRRVQQSGITRISLRQLIDTLVEYRNDQAHGAGQNSTYYSDMVPPLQAALEEALVQVPALARHSLSFVENVSLERGGARAITLLRLMSDRPRLRPLRETLSPDTAHPEPQQLYLLDQGSLTGAIPLHPLLVFLPACAVCGEAQVGILNGLSNRAAEYLCYGCGHTNTLSELLEDVAAFLPEAGLVGAAPAPQGEAEEPPAPPPPPHNLPPEPTEFVGRESEIAAVLALLQRPTERLVTLTGPGGTGKTRLALHSAAQLLPAFSDGVWLVDLAALTDPNLVISTIAEILGLGEVADAPLIETLRKNLADKRLLFVLDNFEQVMQAAPQIANLLKATGGVQLLVTSRMPLRVYGEREFAVQSLSIPSRNPVPPLHKLTEYGAVKLFAERARAVRADFELTPENATAVAEICAQLDGLPLAIELAASRIRLFSPPALLTRLDQRLKILTGGVRDRPARQQTMRAAIDWSYDLLSEDEQRLFARLAVFQGGARLDDIEAVCLGQPDTALSALDLDVFEGLELLISKSLIQQREGQEGEPRFLMLETIREYAREKLAETGEGPVLAQRHADRFLVLAEQAATQLTGNEQAAWLARLAEEQANMRAALEFACGPTGPPAVGLRLATALYRFWGVRGHLAEGRTWYARTLAAAEAKGEADALLRARALDAAGALARLQSDHAAGRLLGEQALALFREAGDRPGTASALRNLAALAIEQGDLQAARAFGEESLAIYRELGDTSGMTMMLHDLGQIAHQDGDLATAVSFYDQALALKRQQGHKRGIAVSLNNLGLIYQEHSQWSPASTLFEEAQALLEEIGDQTGTAVVLTNLANVRHELGDHVSAAALHRQNLKLFAEQGNTMRIAESLEGLAGPAASLGQPARAARLLAAAETLRAAGGIPLPGWERQRYERYRDAARRQLDPSAWEAAWQAGQALDQAGAVAYALAED
jgi:non-specific serine/threonine protein kinase